MKIIPLCVIPWNNLVAEPNGTIKPCCRYNDVITSEGKPANLKTESIDQIFNGEYLTQLRSDMLTGIKRLECESCWQTESMGGKSKRKVALERHAGSFDINPTLTTMELRLGNTCNLKCRICWEESSSKWLAENMKFQPDRVMYLKDLNKSMTWHESESFWNELRSILPHLTKIDFTGGEPFLSKEHWRLLDEINELGLAGNITLSYNTNCTVAPSHALVWQNFKLVTIYVSIDDIGPRFEYQRHGSTWEQVLDVLNTLNACKLTSNITISLWSVVSLFNVYYLPQLIEWSKKQMIFDAIFLKPIQFPHHWALNNITVLAKEQLINRLSGDFGDLQEQIDVIIESITSSKGSDGVEFKSHVDMIDLRRNESFLDNHLEMAKLMNMV